MAQQRYILTLRPAHRCTIGGFGIIMAIILALIVSHTAPTTSVSTRDEYATTFRLLGLHLGDYVHHHDVDCQHFAKPHLARFLKEHPCRSMDRELITVYDETERCILVSVLWIELPDSRTAPNFDDVYEAGDIGTWGASRLHVGEPDLTSATRHSTVGNTLVTDAEAVSCEPAGAADQDIEYAAAVAAWFSRP
jgi:hypothetical protein